ncbi:hypothetical protein ARMGADRAFT_1087703 [Armillaria gallica]|uniref:F-box domain-containing protein n=1 Tax=Armillaria gallica TaxID=47427 RepID=A0A2H3D1F1_ARMGA|nr:hypothetical protein ARMGADRAFT_1087703 [Armillaria gallica]
MVPEKPYDAFLPLSPSYADVSPLSQANGIGGYLAPNPYDAHDTDAFDASVVQYVEDTYPQESHEATATISLSQSESDVSSVSAQSQSDQSLNDEMDEIFDAQSSLPAEETLLDPESVEERHPSMFPKLLVTHLLLKKRNSHRPCIPVGCERQSDTPLEVKMCSPPQDHKQIPEALGRVKYKFRTPGLSPYSRHTIIFKDPNAPSHTPWVSMSQILKGDRGCVDMSDSVPHKVPGKSCYIDVVFVHLGINRKQYVSISSPIRHLLNETLTEIVLHTIDSPGSDDSGLTETLNSSSSLTAITIGIVCSRWRSIALSTKALWTTFTFGIMEKYEGSTMECLELYLSRSGNAPISFTGYMKGSRGYARSSGGFHCWGGSLPFFSRVKCTQLRTLRLDDFSGTYGGHQLTFISPFPALVHIKHLVFSRRSLHDISVLIAHLQFLHLVSINITRDKESQPPRIFHEADIPISPIVALLSVPDAPRLHCASAQHRRGRALGRTLIQLLAVTPALTELRLTCWQWDSGETIFERLTLSTKGYFTSPGSQPSNLIPKLSVLGLATYNAKVLVEDDLSEMLISRFEPSAILREIEGAKSLNSAVIECCVLSEQFMLSAG